MLRLFTPLERPASIERVGRRLVWFLACIPMGCAEGDDDDPHEPEVMLQGPYDFCSGDPEVVSAFGTPTVWYLCEDGLGCSGSFEGFCTRGCEVDEDCPSPGAPYRPACWPSDDVAHPLGRELEDPNMCLLRCASGNCPPGMKCTGEATTSGHFCVSAF